MGEAVITGATQSFPRLLPRSWKLLSPSDPFAPSTRTVTDLNLHPIYGAIIVTRESYGAAEVRVMVPASSRGLNDVP